MSHSYIPPPPLGTSLSSTNSVANSGHMSNSGNNYHKVSSLSALQQGRRKAAIGAGSLDSQHASYASGGAMPMHKQMYSDPRNAAHMTRRGYLPQQPTPHTNGYSSMQSLPQKYN